MLIFSYSLRIFHKSCWEKELHPSAAFHPEHEGNARRDPWVWSLESIPMHLLRVSYYPVSFLMYWRLYNRFETFHEIIANAAAEGHNLETIQQGYVTAIEVAREKEKATGLSLQQQRTAMNMTISLLQVGSLLLLSRNVSDLVSLVLCNVCLL